MTAQRYLQQFQELYTEEGRKSVKISTFVANQRNQNQQSQQSSSSSSSTNQQSNQQQQQQQTQHQQQQQQQQTTTQQHPQVVKVVSISSDSTQPSNQTFTVTQNPVLSQGGNTYILATSVPGLQQSLKLGSNVVPMSISSSFAQALVSRNAAFTVSGTSIYNPCL